VRGRGQQGGKEHRGRGEDDAWGLIQQEVAWRRRQSGGQRRSTAGGRRAEQGRHVREEEEERGGGPGDLFEISRKFKDLSVN
jgi:hypothetical protein